MRTPFTPEQIKAREAVWRASQDGEPLYLTCAEVHDLWRSIADTGAELAQLRDEVKHRRFEDPTIRTPAVQAALEQVRRTGKTSMRGEDGRPSNIAHVVGYSLCRGAEAVQQEIDRYAELVL